MSQYRQHADMRGVAINRRAERLLGIAVACLIGIGLAAGLVYGWSAG